MGNVCQPLVENNARDRVTCRITDPVPGMRFLHAVRLERINPNAPSWTQQPLVPVVQLAQPGDAPIGISTRDSHPDTGATVFGGTGVYPVACNTHVTVGTELQVGPDGTAVPLTAGGVKVGTANSRTENGVVYVHVREPLLANMP
jgi:hypothetical protein